MVRVHVTHTFFYCKIIIPDLQNLASHKVDGHDDFIIAEGKGGDVKMRQKCVTHEPLSIKGLQMCNFWQKKSMFFDSILHRIWLEEG